MEAKMIKKFVCFCVLIMLVRPSLVIDSTLQVQVLTVCVYLTVDDY